MSIRNVIRCPLEIVLLPRSIRKQKDLNRRKPYFYASAGALILCLLIFASGVSMMLEFNRKRVSRVKQEVAVTENKHREVSQLVGNLNSAKGAFEETTQIFKERNRWGEVIDELRSMMPDTMWLLTVEGQGDAPEGGENPANGGAKNAAASERDRFLKAAELQEIKRLRITGCTLVYNDNKLQEKELMDKVAQSKFFASADIKERQQPSELNLTGFEMYLSLKEPIKK